MTTNECATYVDNDTFEADHTSTRDWHHYTGELTYDQVQIIAATETLFPAEQESHRRAAQRYAVHNALQSAHADMSAPADAVRVGPWKIDNDSPRPYREFAGAQHVIEAGSQPLAKNWDAEHDEAVVTVCGVQDDQGNVARYISVTGKTFSRESGAKLLTALAAALSELDAAPTFSVVR
ncbi:hypothetical protein [Mycolicibacterium sp.]|uniref:hypothetical protein n=1 Tax=Mycolicibacterium sp. TaxID=2320850 RepID=UPI0037CBAB4F